MNTKNKNFKIFIDFDGTITQQDVGEQFFLKFGDAEEAYGIIKLWLNGEINSKETWIRLAETVDNLNLNEFDSFLDEMHIDPDFAEFIKFTEANNFETVILSDGLDYYIDKILKREKFDYIKTYSNKLEFGKNNEMILSFPYEDEECKICANCKRNHVINHSGDEEISIYIGDGYSDVCPAQFCDFIFAKRSLLKYCEKNRITYFPFTTFRDVQKRIEVLKNKTLVKKRRQAQLKRNEVYSQG
ncbi:MAG: MtnX-like HAD-IB family phosphatase [Chlorobi bacterium]|nr:MtnX-like HAD-IB family phosphatase [Chlorobiota bacterium]